MKEAWLTHMCWVVPKSMNQVSACLVEGAELALMNMSLFLSFLLSSFFLCLVFFLVAFLILFVCLLCLVLLALFPVSVFWGLFWVELPTIFDGVVGATAVAARLVTLFVSKAVVLLELAR